MIINIPDIPNKTNAFSVTFPVQGRVNGEWRSDHQARFSDACFALECDGWRETRFSKLEVNVPLLFMRPEWAKPMVLMLLEVSHAMNTQRWLLSPALYWKPTGVAKAMLEKTS